MALELNELKSHLWNCADILRGSAVDRTDWKAFILALLFFKRICDVYDEETAEATELFGARSGFHSTGSRGPHICFQRMSGWKLGDTIPVAVHQLCRSYGHACFLRPQPFRA